MTKRSRTLILGGGVGGLTLRCELASLGVGVIITTILILVSVAVVATHTRNHVVVVRRRATTLTHDCIPVRVFGRGAFVFGLVRRRRGRCAVRRLRRRGRPAVDLHVLVVLPVRVTRRVRPELPRGACGRSIGMVIGADGNGGGGCSGTWRAESIRHDRVPASVCLCLSCIQRRSCSRVRFALPQLIRRRRLVAAMDGNGGQPRGLRAGVNRLGWKWDEREGSCVPRLARGPSSACTSVGARRCLRRRGRTAGFRWLDRSWDGGAGDGRKHGAACHGPPHGNHHVPRAKVHEPGQPRHRRGVRSVLLLVVVWVVGRHGGIFFNLPWRRCARGVIRDDPIGVDCHGDHCLACVRVDREKRQRPPNGVSQEEDIRQRASRGVRRCVRDSGCSRRGLRRLGGCALRRASARGGWVRLCRR